MVIHCFGFFLLFNLIFLLPNSLIILFYSSSLSGNFSNYYLQVPRLNPPLT